MFRFTAAQRGNSSAARHYEPVARRYSLPGEDFLCGCPGRLSAASLAGIQGAGKFL